MSEFRVGDETAYGRVVAVGARTEAEDGRVYYDTLTEQGVVVERRTKPPVESACH